MYVSGNTILITGGGSASGAALPRPSTLLGTR